MEQKSALSKIRLSLTRALEKYIGGHHSAYHSFWSPALSSIREVREYGDLPQTCREAIEFFERETGAHAVMLSVGQERDETIVVKAPIL